MVCRDGTADAVVGAAVRSALRTVALACVVSLVLSPAAHAQGSEGFVQAVAEFINTADNASGVELVVAVEAMATGLARWDASIARVEGGLAAEVGAAPPAVAARMRTALGAVYIERGRLEAALGQLDAAAALDPSASDIDVFRAVVLDRLGGTADAAEAYHQAWKRDPASPSKAYRFLRSLPEGAASPDAGPATATLRRALAAAPDPAAPFVIASFTLFDDAAAPTPVIPAAIYAEPFALLRQGRFDEALVRFRAVVAARSSVVTDAGGDEAQRLAAADAAVAAGDIVAGRQRLLETIRTFPQSHRAQWKLGTLLQGQGDQRGAADAFDAAAPGAIAGGASLYLAIGRWRHTELDLPAAADAYRHRIALAPNDSAAHYDLADVDRAGDDLDSALVEALASALLDRSNARPLVMIGQLDTAAGRDAEALEVLGRAVALAPGDAEARYAFSRALLRAGRTDDAQRELGVFQQLQAEAMAQVRRRFEDNLRMIEETLKSGEPPRPAR